MTLDDITDAATSPPNAASPPLPHGYRDLCNYIATTCPAEASVRPGANAGEIAIRWHVERERAREELEAAKLTIERLERRLDEIEQAKAEYEAEGVGTEWQDRLEQCGQILDQIDKLPSRAADFGESVREKVEGMMVTITDTERVTEKQRAALDNMQAAVERWLK